MRPDRRARRTTRRCLAFTTGLLLALQALTGCSDDGDAAFAASYEQVTSDYRAAVQQAQAAGRAAEASGGATAVYQQLRTATREAADRYGALDAPQDAEDALGALTDGLEDQVEALDRVLTAAQDNDAVAVRAALSDYAKALGAWQSARQRVDAALEGGPARAGP